ncbi:MAG: hypothetical protein CL609_12270 [Anaerolineaceae bacterium]|nr:hypothetical protein [Anaerolineaceae bacterium]
MKNIDKIGVQIPDIYLPKSEIDLSKWAVIACDQFTSQPEYWNQVEMIVGNNPSTYHMILPEVFLESTDEEARIQHTQNKMREYLRAGIFQKYEGIILVERTVKGKTRSGIILALDLEKYDFNKGSQTLIRATEGTIIERLPPRIRIREGANMEFPHILVLIDDPDFTVIEPLRNRKDKLRKLYDFDLMQGSGHIRGYGIDNAEEQSDVINALENLADPKLFKSRYNLEEDQGVLLFAMGDGNHSLATAKAIWEKIKHQVGPDHPARYALVEIENVHDSGLEFEPIHRVVFNVKENPIEAMKKYWKEDVEIIKGKNQEEVIYQVDHQTCDCQKFGYIDETGFYTVCISNPQTNLPVGSLQLFLDQWLKDGKAEKIDYVHGETITCELGARKNNCGFYLPAMEKSELFRTVILDGALPRKTFSMGEAEEKRFYLEGRLISK